MLVIKDAYQRETLTKWPVRLPLSYTAIGKEMMEKWKIGVGKKHGFVFLYPKNDFI